VNFLQIHVAAYLLLAPFGGSLAQEHATTQQGALLDEHCAVANAEEISSQRLTELSREALQIADVERAAELAIDALCHSSLEREGPSRQIEHAAEAVERLLDAGDIDLANSIIALYVNGGDFDINNTTPSHLRFQAARARALSYQDKKNQSLELRLNLQTSLDLMFGEYSSDAIENHLRIANLYIELGNISMGLSELNRLTAIALVHFSDDSQLRRLILESQALGLAISGDELDALSKLRNLRQALASTFGKDNRRVIDLDEDIASVLIRNEKIEEALTIESSVFLWRKRFLPPNHQHLLLTLWRLSYLFIVNQRIETARSVLSYVQQQLKTTKTLGASLMMFQTMSRIASIDARNGDFETAGEIWRQVYEGDRRLLGDWATDTQIEATNYANALMLSGKTELACALLATSLERQLRRSTYDIWSTDFTRISYSRCLLETKNPALIEQARQSLKETWTEILQHAGEQSPHALLALATFAKAALLSGHRSEAKSLLSRLVFMSEQNRDTSTSGIPVRDSAFSTWFEGKTAVGEEVPGYRNLALMHAQDVELERALRVSELARDRTLRDRFAEQDWRRTRLPEDARRRLDELLDRIQNLDERIAVEPEIVERIRLESERTLAVAERGRLERELREQLHIGEPASDPPTLDELRAHLAADTALVSVLHSGDAWWALVISRDDPARFVEFHDPDLGRNATAWVRRLRGDPVRAWPLAGNRLALDDARPDGAIGPYLTPEQLAQRLSHVLLSPLARAVGKARHLVFVGDDELVGIPLQALPFESGLALDRFELSYAPSLTTYARWQGPARPKAHSRDLLAIGAIDHPRLAPPATDDPIVVGVQYAAEHPLPFAREEIDAIAAQFPAHRANAWTGSQANKASLRRASRAGDLLRYRYVHFATHAWAQPDQPESSAIVLAGGNGDLPTQRALTAAELAGLHMGSELIVLSACDTGVGHFEHGRGLLGLAYAGLAAGNRAALLSLWPIADDTTALFMKRLYAKLRRGINPVTALAATQREFRRSGDSRLSDPLVWAPFVLYGGY